ncbi:NAD-dependent epimerase/dehydratase family protein [Pseudomonas sp. NBRC 111125]|uniref:NAD-dependent epimerase/dehydratase family protein n=1 Tax=Pseudomonas sp. NBRC 111125 TaxID=1661040 RepID=UPI000760CC14|nr:NAD-dependent epimerase/dehydratase family protein [Pseudomonas sp. NBRC 111125]
MSESLHVLVTGANGFVGRQLCDVLTKQGCRVTAAVRTVDAPPLAGHGVAVDLLDGNALSECMATVDVVVHLAARAHVLDDRCPDPLAAFRQANVTLAASVAHAAIKAGVKRFVFISSIGVNGAETHGQPFSETMPAAPHAPYAVSKLEAELELTALFTGTQSELVIVRPPLIYDAAAPGNFSRLLRLVEARVPLPFAGVENRRSMISLSNLVSFIGLVLEHPLAAGETFVIADGEGVSTRQIVDALAAGMGHRAKFFFVPGFVVKCLLSAVRKQNMFTQLYGSLEVDSTKAVRLLGWVPPESPYHALKQAGSRFKARDAREQ